MKPLIVLIGAFILSLLVSKFIFGDLDYFLSGNIAMSAMLAFTAIGHFAFTKGMILMIPDFIPFKKRMVYLTGVIEIAAAAGLLISGLRQTTSIFLIVFFILILPANIYSSIKKVDYQKGTHDGKGLQYLWFRIPLQILFIFWVFCFGLQFLK